jgi:hypothetical protein
VEIVAVPAPVTLGGNNSIASTSSVSTATNPSTGLAPLTPVILTASSVNGHVVIVVIVAPLPIISHSGPSSAPVTAQSFQSILSSLGLPTSITRFGQPLPEPPMEPETGSTLLFPLDVSPRIDYVEPFQPEAPNGQDQPAPPAAASQGQWWPVLLNAHSRTVLDPSLEKLLPGSPAQSLPIEQTSSDEVRASLGLSTLFGAAAVAAGGYQLILGDFDRFKGRWIHGRAAQKPHKGRHFGAWN